MKEKKNKYENKNEPTTTQKAKNPSTQNKACPGGKNGPTTNGPTTDNK